MENNAETPEAPTEQGPSQFGSLAGAIGAKNLIIIIIAMPFVFLVVVMGIIAAFGNPNASDSDRAAQVVPVSTAADTGAQELDETVISYPAGMTPGAMAMDGDRLAIRLDGSDGAVVVVYDLAESKVIARIPFSAEPDEPQP
ncbi:hypothetical protein PUV54_04835 [Hyphococcus flavus]|uniref:Uncharacterized protein n=1 Tax=Hyphococcus flavus TaxID=1866326 RepID=A0AAF0CGL0_9PROT|nr:hypothetical protein [Hyphococcus flavus]WDI32519.1 hypothetical protein PUV54_04835 [Hyphococcus flavus]